MARGSAKYGKKKSQGLRRQRNQNQKPQPQAPQAWITMLWHMKLRLPWTWRLGPSNSSERGHVVEMLEQEEFPDETLFCGDAGFVGYPLWHTILKRLANFLVRVGANVSLLSETADIRKCGGGIVLCWPKGRMNSGDPPLRLRLVKVQIGRTKMWMLTSVLDRYKLTKRQIVRIYKMRWGIEVEFRGLKQTLDKHTLRCRNSDRLLVELDWSIRAMAIAELLALREQMTTEDGTPDEAYDPIDRSLANTMRALRTCMRNLHQRPRPEDRLRHQLSKALVQRYVNHTDKRSRYRPKNPDKKPLGDPEIRKMTTEERNKLVEFQQKQAA
jgi:Transposase DDE domain